MVAMVLLGRKFDRRFEILCFLLNFYNDRDIFKDTRKIGLIKTDSHHPIPSTHHIDRMGCSLRVALFLST